MTPPRSERRSKGRISASLPVSMTEGRTQTASGVTRDLSTNGIFVYTDARMSPGSSLEMVLMLPPELTDGEKKWVCCQASVVRVEEPGTEGRFGVAASIDSIATLPEIIP